MTFDLCRRYVDEWSLVTEEERVVVVVCGANIDLSTLKHVL